MTTAETSEEEPIKFTQASISKMAQMDNSLNNTLDHPEHHIWEEEETQAPTYVLAQIEMDNSPLEELWINAKTNILQKLAIQEMADKKEKTLEEMVPLELFNYKDIFDKVTAE